MCVLAASRRLAHAGGHPSVASCSCLSFLCTTRRAPVVCRFSILLALARAHSSWRPSLCPLPATAPHTPPAVARTLRIARPDARALPHALATCPGSHHLLRLTHPPDLAARPLLLGQIAPLGLLPLLSPPIVRLLFPLAISTAFPASYPCFLAAPRCLLIVPPMPSPLPLPVLSPRHFLRHQFLRHNTASITSGKTLYCLRRGRRPDASNQHPA